MSVAVKITVHPALQNLPILRRLLVNVLIMWQSSVPGGKFGSRILACPMACMRLPLAVSTVVGVVLVVKVLVGALEMAVKLLLRCNLLWGVLQAAFD
jgi:hypothetical protein